VDHRSHPSATQRQSRGEARGGVTLIEVLVVLAILAVIVGLALPRLDTAGFRADANVRHVRTTLQRAHRLAQQQQHDVIVSFDTVAGRIRTVEDSNSSGRADLGEHVVWRGLTDGARFVVPPAGISGAVSSAVAGKSISALDGMPTVTFHRDGSGSSNLEIYIQVRGSRSDAVRGVTLARSSPTTHWHRLVGGAWKAGG
jgi:prepilin-type N-terminal cleavage/methylation domain-containing protein